jgi:predicted transcriptional regulator
MVKINSLQMKLKQFLKNKKITIEKFSVVADIPYTTICKYVHGKRKPSEAYMNKIYRITNGNVSPNDFYNL